MTGPQHAAIVGTGLAAGGWVLHPFLAIVGLIALVAVGVMWRNQRSGSTGLVNRWSNRSRRNQGVASSWQILAFASPWTIRRKAAILRPSLADLRWWARWRVPIRELATPLIRSGRLKVWSSIDETTLTTGGLGTGKSGALATWIDDAPGMVVATSTATDLLDSTYRVRSRLGPVLVFNPTEIGGRPTTLTFNPLMGCENPMTARYRAGDLLAGLPTPGHDGEYWINEARAKLTVFLHAAALGNATMWDVHSWLSNPSATADEVLRHLVKSPQSLPMTETAIQYFELSDRARGSVASTILQALEWMHDPRVDAVTQTNNLHVEALLEQRATVHLLGAKETHTTPLATALTAHIAREARRIATMQPKGRLDPPLLFALDEAALICPVPLDEWTADNRKRNITIRVALQSLAQARKQWGVDGTSAILTNAKSLLVFGGTRCAADLAEYTALTGHRDVDGHQVPVLAPALIEQLPDEYAVLIRRGMRPVIGRVPMVWKRRDIGRWRRAAVALGQQCSADIDWARSRFSKQSKSVDETPAPRLRVLPPPPEQDVA